MVELVAPCYGSRSSDLDRDKPQTNRSSDNAELQQVWVPSSGELLGKKAGFLAPVLSWIMLPILQQFYVAYQISISFFQTQNAKSKTHPHQYFKILATTDRKIDTKYYYYVYIQSLSL